MTKLPTALTDESIVAYYDEDGITYQIMLYSSLPPVDSKYYWVVPEQAGTYEINDRILCELRSQYYWQYQPSTLLRTVEAINQAGAYGLHNPSADELELEIDDINTRLADSEPLFAITGSRRRVADQPELGSLACIAILRGFIIEPNKRNPMTKISRVMVDNRGVSGRRQKIVNLLVDVPQPGPDDPSILEGAEQRQPKATKLPPPKPVIDLPSL